jgi:hypothetical protein
VNTPTVTVIHLVEMRAVAPGEMRHLRGGTRQLVTDHRPVPRLVSMAHPAYLMLESRLAAAPGEPVAPAAGEAAGGAAAGGEAAAGAAAAGEAAGGVAAAGEAAAGEPAGGPEPAAAEAEAWRIAAGRDGGTCPLAHQPRAVVEVAPHAQLHGPVVEPPFQRHHTAGPQCFQGVTLQEAATQQEQRLLTSIIAARRGCLLSACVMQLLARM